MNFSTMGERSAFQNSILKRRGLGFGHDPWGHWKALSVEIVGLNLDVFKVVIIGFFLDEQTFFFGSRVGNSCKPLSGSKASTGVLISP